MNKTTLETKHAEPTIPARHRSAFTLIEVMVVMVVGGILLGLGASMMATARQSSRISRTRAVVSVINEVINQRLESLRTRPFPINLPAPVPPVVRMDLTPPQAARARLLMMRDMMRMELPDRYSDLIVDPNVSVASANGYTEPTVIQALATTTLLNGTRVRQVPTRVQWWNPTGGFPNHNIPGQLSAYRARLPIGPGNRTTWTPELASSECLYLIMSTTFIGGTSAIEMLPRGHVEDTDGDGVPEIIDGWGNPIGFIRWPVGFVEPGRTTFPQTVAELRPEDADIFRSDYAYAPGATQAQVSTRPLPRSLRPLIVSAGPDGVFDLRFVQTGGSGDVIYSRQTWPVQPNWVGPSNMPPNPYPAAYRYIDPYLRQSVAAGLIGETIDTDGDGTLTGVSDNISNYDLEAEAE